MAAKKCECYLINAGELMAKCAGYWRAQGSVVTLRTPTNGGSWKCRVSYAQKWAKQAETAHVAYDDARDDSVLWIDFTR